MPGPLVWVVFWLSHRASPPAPPPGLRAQGGESWAGLLIAWSAPWCSQPHFPCSQQETGRSSEECGEECGPGAGRAARAGLGRATVVLAAGPSVLTFSPILVLVSPLHLSIRSDERKPGVHGPGPEMAADPFP